MALLKEDIEELYDRVPVVTEGEIYYKVNKITFDGKTTRIVSFGDLYSGYRRKVTNTQIFPSEAKYYSVQYL